MRRDSIFVDVIKLPWPVGVAAAAIVFFSFHAYQSFAPQNELNQAALSIARIVVYIFSAMFLFAAFLSFLSQKIRSERFKNTQSISDLRSLTWLQFESYVGEMFRERKYIVLETDEGPDNGVDLVLRKDGEKTYVQCKHWKSNSVGIEKIRELLGTVTAGGAQAGIFVTTGNYTKPAKQFARECGIELWDGERLAESFGELKSSLEDIESFDNAVIVTCPICQSPMLKRVAKRGPNMGNSFWGCSRFPACRGTREVMGSE